MVKTAKNNKKSKKNYSRKIIKRKKHMKKNKTFRKKNKNINLRTRTLKYRGGNSDKQLRLLNQRKQKIKQLCSKLDVGSNDYNTLDCNALTKQSNLSNNEIMSGKIDEKINSIEKKNKKTMELRMSQQELAGSNPGNRENNEINVETNKKTTQLKSINKDEEKTSDADDETKDEEKTGDADDEINKINKLMNEIKNLKFEIEGIKKKSKIKLSSANTMDQSKTIVIQNQKNEIKSLETSLKLKMEEWQQQMKTLQTEHSDMIGKIKQEANFKFIKEMEKKQTATVLANENNKRQFEEMEKKHANEIEGIKKIHDKQIKNIQTNQSQNIQTMVPPISGFKQDVMTEYNMSESKDGQYKILTIKMYYPNNNKSTYSSLSVTGKKDQKPSTTNPDVKSLRDIVKQAKIKSEELKTPATQLSELTKDKPVLGTDSGEDTDSDEEVIEGETI